MALTYEELLAVIGPVTVPGTPLTLRVTDWCVTPGAAPRVSWIFDDPGAEGKVVDGATAVRADDAVLVWLDVQLDAAWVFCSTTDSDWTPGVPPIRREWSPEQAWEALLGFLGRDGAPVTVSRDEVRGRNLTLRGVTPELWAAFLNSVENVAPEDDADETGHVVPVGTPTEGDGLPLWADDQLTWGFGDVSVLALVDGELTDQGEGGSRMLVSCDVDCGEVLPGHRLVVQGLREDGWSDDDVHSDYTEHREGKPVHRVVSCVYAFVPGLSEPSAKAWLDVDATVALHPPLDASVWGTAHSMGGERDARPGGSQTAGAFGPFVLPEGTERVDLELTQVLLLEPDAPRPAADVEPQRLGTLEFSITPGRARWRPR